MANPGRDMTTASAHETLAAIIRRNRENQGLTQAQLAEASGLVNRTIQRLETGRAATPNMATLQKLAGALGVDVRDLIPGSPDVNLPEVHGDAPPNK